MKTKFNPSDFIWNGMDVSTLTMEELQQALCKAIEQFEEVRIIKEKIDGLIAWADSND